MDEKMRHLAIASLGIVAIPFQTIKEILKLKGLQHVLPRWADECSVKFCSA